MDQTIRRIARALDQAGIDTSRLDARLLVQAATGLAHQDIICRPDHEIELRQMAVLERMMAKRLAREPVSRILGHREFHGLDFLITPDVLDPRPDSEVLVETALTVLKTREQGSRVRIVDVGTGTGCLLISLLSELGNAHGTGIDVSPEALRCAKINAARLGVAERVSFVCGSWLSGVAGPFDVLVSNPPYIRSRELSELQPEVALHDPALALDGGETGLVPYHAIMGNVSRVLAPGGCLFFEIGADQADDVMRLLRQGGVPAPRAFRDLAGIRRVVGGQFTGNSP